MKCPKCGIHYDDSERVCPMCGAPRTFSGKKSTPHFSGYDHTDFSGDDCTHETYSTYTDADREISYSASGNRSSQQSSASSSSTMQGMLDDLAEARDAKSNSTSADQMKNIFAQLKQANAAGQKARKKSPPVQLIVALVIFLFLSVGGIELIGNLVQNFLSITGASSSVAVESDDPEDDTDGYSTYQMPAMLSGTFVSEDDPTFSLVFDPEDSYQSYYTESGDKNGLIYTETGEVYSVDITDNWEDYNSGDLYMPIDEGLMAQGYRIYYLDFTPDADDVASHYEFFYLDPDDSDSFILYDDGTAPPIPEGKTVMRRTADS